MSGAADRPALLLLTGGASTRMGTDKAALIVDGVALGAMPVRALAGVCGAVVVAGPVPPGVDGRQVEDTIAGAGPLAGLVAALEAAPTEVAVVVGCDMPSIEPALVTVLLEDLDRTHAAAAVCEGERGLEPFPAALRRSAAAALRLALASGTRSLRDGYAAAGATVVPPTRWRRADPSGASFVSWNRPDDLPPGAAR